MRHASSDEAVDRVKECEYRSDMEQQVEVIAVEGNQALVRGQRASACGGCAGKTSCSTMGSWIERAIELKVNNSVSAAVGDQVLLEVPDSLLLKVSFKLYALPMLAFVFVGLAMRSFALQQGLPHAELLAAVAGLAAVIVTFAWQMVSPLGKKTSLDIRMVKVIRQAESLVG
ncbi:sigma-E factor negative regulatory protein RseC [Mariprofundus micogutta]|uniref:Sigma-E factor negative regulatory protein RseC n=1 Tax=Mariprofundus micogutta TaxID=1921010 RepID=A0A1L8CL10_9PROT|nr:SoxR reducing system RseC family protein [Mariprofundus micogutta]GAV19575.1 sigma-E factor negative regulatory protein RseC [Mariprofundus micogutta]